VSLDLGLQFQLYFINERPTVLSEKINLHEVLLNYLAGAAIVSLVFRHVVQKDCLASTAWLAYDTIS